jgi:alkylation response protein AidB-like acyl-CoA dehydrogenase
MFAEQRAAYRAFMEEHVYPNERTLYDDDETLIAELRSKAKAAGLWAPHLPPEAGGTGQGFLAYAHLNEEIGRSSHAQLVFNCQALDAGNGEILQGGAGAERRDRPSGSDARRARPHRPVAAVGHVHAGLERADLRRPGRGDRMVVSRRILKAFTEGDGWRFS